MKYMAVAWLCVVLTACTSSETVYLKDPMGAMAQCGPYSGGGIGAAPAAVNREKLRDCVGDYQRQGYERTPAPGG